LQQTPFIKMKILAFLLILLAIDLPDVNKIAKINQLKNEAVVAYNKKMYNVAANRYKTLLTEFGLQDEKIQLNLAHAYYQMSDTVNAYKQYSELTAAKDKDIRSIAHQQIGNLRAKAKDLESALLHYKSALKAAPKNEAARLNYELVKKLIEQKKQQQQQNKENQENSEQEKSDQEKQKEQQNKKEEDKKEQEKKQEQQQKESEGGEKKEDDGKKKQAERDDQSKEKGKEKEKSELRAERMAQMNIPENQANSVLDAMKSSEIQYLQQNQKKPTKKTDKNKPDW
jgi:Ca-activated chloride channel family protein